jgi:hypothetical protein
VLVYNSLPTRPDQRPDFAVGSPDINTNTLDTNFIVSNPAPASNGKNLFVVSDFDRKMYVWKHLPDESGARPDFAYIISAGPSDVALKGNTLAVVGMNGIMIWKKPPLNGEMPDLALVDTIGSARLRRASGVAIDDRYFYLADSEAGKIYVWEGIPDRDSDPKYTLNVGQGVGRLSSDGSYLVAVAGGAGNLDRSVLVFKVADIPRGTEPTPIGSRGLFDLPPNQVAVSQGQLFVPQTHLNRVLVWNKIEDAIAGKAPDVLLGKSEPNDVRPRITRDQLFWPSAVCFDGSYLWVGEFKFSDRLLRFSPSP